MAEEIRQYADDGPEKAPEHRVDLYARAARLIGRFPDRESATDLATEHDRYLEEAFFVDTVDEHGE